VTMPADRRFFGKTRLLSLVARVFMSAGVIGVVFALVTHKQNVLSWSAISVGAGLAVGFAREAFRPRRQLEEDPGKTEADSK
jgi:hypothetical protein